MAKILLCGVVKPYGVVDDEYGDALCTMELLNNQVTREQGVHSPRSNNYSYGLYLMAENIHVATTVLDFPTWDEFTREVDSGQYTHVGISFIVPNVLKAGRMAQYIRTRHPNIKIILGGHGTAIPNLEEMIVYDEICRGEGVSWLRQYFGEDPDRPLIHPTLLTSVNSYIYGAPILEKAGILITGVGCTNSCRFCATSHKFEKKYTSFLHNGRDLYDACHKAEKAYRVNDYGLMDENFFKNPRRATELLAEMESGKKAYTFSTFSSAETIKKMGIDFLVRMGVTFLWIGVESKADLFEKTRGIDLKALIADLQNHGITVLASAILFLEHHDKNTIEEDINWAIGLESDLMQFMQWGPMPGTRLYEDYDALGKLRNDVSWTIKHGQNTIWFHHPHFTAEESSRYLIDAFTRKYHAQGPGVMNMAWTALKGYRTMRAQIEEREKSGLVWNPATLRYSPGDAGGRDDYMHLRLEVMRRNATRFRPAMAAMLRYAPNRAAAEKCRRLIAEYQETFGPLSWKDRAMAAYVRVSSWIENRRIRKHGTVMRQPPTIRTEYPLRVPISVEKPELLEEKTVA